MLDTPFQKQAYDAFGVFVKVKMARAVSTSA
jgi:hypothetical protein